MDSIINEEQEIKEFFIQNKQMFEDKLLSEAINVKEKIKEILLIGNIDLLSNAHKLVLYVVEQREDELVSFAHQEGVAWAKYSLTLAFKLEWIHAIRRTVWDFLYNYDRLNKKDSIREEFYTLEKKINDKIDLFLNCFFISYSKYRDELIESQRELVENLSVPIIPITPTICVLPLIGTIDTCRSETIKEKVLIEIGNLRIQTLIMDLSGVAQMETSALTHLLKVLDGIVMMGCKPVITGLRPEFVRKMINSGLTFQHKAELKVTLQQALQDYLTIGC